MQEILMCDLKEGDVFKHKPASKVLYIVDAVVDGIIFFSNGGENFDYVPPLNQRVLLLLDNEIVEALSEE